MRLGLQVPSFTWPNGQSQLGETFAQIAENADRAGLYSMWVMDHFFQIPNVGPVENEMLEGWSALSFAAGLTSRIRLGTMVTGVTYRYPGILVKTATTLDVLSGGRTYFGIGAAWNEQEHVGLGVPFPPLAERFERLEETLQIALQMWAGEEKAYDGKHYHLARTLNSPQAVQRPHPPILIGGSGERKTLRLVAKYGDACNLFARLGKDVMQHKLDVLREHCQQVGRPYEEIEKTTYGQITGTESDEQLVERFQRLAGEGVDLAIVELPDQGREGSLERLAELLSSLANLAVAG